MEAARRRSRLNLRSGSEGVGRRRSGHTGKSRSQMTYSKGASQGAAYYDGYEGDHNWVVSHRTDDHITYTRRDSSSSSHGQGQGQPGELRRLGTGSDSVSDRMN